MADIVKLLPDHVANQIAAGEVVQRPASVVKELLENAIDAGAKHIKLILKQAGKTLIQVVDNGRGMSTTDARLSFERHATSKIQTAEDLFNLNSKGFRGEALASIAAVSRVEMNTKLHNEDVGSKIRIEAGKVISQDVTVCASGTSVEVKNLFYNIPARRNFLKSDTVELRRIIDEFYRVALSHTDIIFSAYHNGNEMFHLPATTRRKRLCNVFGDSINEKLVPVKENTSVIAIKGFVGKPEAAKKRRGQQFFFVNNRFIKSPYLHHAVVSAFEGLIAEQNIPAYFLFFKINPASIDINIHPTKTEVKFEDEHTIYATLKAAIKHSLGQFSIRPALDFDNKSSFNTPYNFKDRQPVSPTIEINSGFNPFSAEDRPAVNTNGSGEKWEALYAGSQAEANRLYSDLNSVALDKESSETASLFPETEKLEPDPIPVYQLHRKYLVAAIKSGVLIINQYRAHSRVLYEHFLQNITLKEAACQKLLFPVQIELSPDDKNLIQTAADPLIATGFLFDFSDPQALKVTGVPPQVKENEISSIIENLISDLQLELPEKSFSLSDHVAKALSKNLAVKIGKKLESHFQESLVNNLFACKAPSVSPFNKPVFITMTVDELDKKFM